MLTNTDTSSPTAQTLSRADVSADLLALDDGNGVAFVIKNFKAPDGYKECGGAIKCKPDAPVRFEFKLKNKSKHDLRFAKTEPFRIREGFDCPPRGSGVWKGFAVVDPDDEQLTVEYEGSPANTIFSYVLQFDSEAGPVEFDPIIINSR